MPFQHIWFPCSPTGVINRVLDSMRRNFLWHWNTERKVYHLVKWKAVICGKKSRGLGIKTLKVQSKALRMKWLWKYTREHPLLWGRVIKAKYEQVDSWMTKEVTTPYGVSLWRSIRALWSELKAQSKIRVLDWEQHQLLERQLAWGWKFGNGLSRYTQLSSSSTKVCSRYVVTSGMEHQF